MIIHAHVSVIPIVVPSRSYRYFKFCFTCTKQKSTKLFGIFDCVKCSPEAHRDRSTGKIYFGFNWVSRVTCYVLQRHCRESESNDYTVCLPIYSLNISLINCDRIKSIWLAYVMNVRISERFEYRPLLNSVVRRTLPRFPESYVFPGLVFYHSWF